VDAWLRDAADAIAATTGADRGALELDESTERTLLDLARIAAHESGKRTNAPLLCYLVGRAAAAGAAVDDLADAVRRSTS
jgi:hypothetical protein